MASLASEVAVSPPTRAACPGLGSMRPDNISDAIAALPRATWAGSTARVMSRRPDPSAGAIKAVLLSADARETKLHEKAKTRALLEARLDAAKVVVKERREMAQDMGRLRAEEEKLVFPVAAPWDLKRGRIFGGENEFDVRAPRAGKRLLAILKCTAVTHWGNECRSFSRARDKPIPRAAGGGPWRRLRDAAHPE